MPGQITPPIFVLYDNGSIDAVESMYDAVSTIAVAKRLRAVGAWDSRGWRLVLDTSGSWPIMSVAGDEADPTELRSVLIARLSQDGDEDLDRLDDESLIIRSFERLRSRRFDEMASSLGCCAFPFWGMALRAWRRRS